MTKKEKKKKRIKKEKQKQKRDGVKSSQVDLSSLVLVCGGFVSRHGQR